MILKKGKNLHKMHLLRRRGEREGRLKYQTIIDEIFHERHRDCVMKR